MSLIKDFAGNISYLAKTGVSKVLQPTPISNQELALSSLNFTGNADPSDREAVFPQWFFSARLGQPRQINLNELRTLSKSAWAQMVMNTFKKQIMTTDWDILLEDKEENIESRKDDIKKVKAFLHKINKNNDSIDDINAETISDVAGIDAGTWNYVYTADSYTIGEVPVYDALGRIENTELGLILKPLGQRELSAVKTVDGGTMLKQVDIHKNLLNYWQYSFKHPRQNPTRFEPEEISMMIMNRAPYSIYGFSPIQAVQQVLELLMQGTRYNKDLYTNNAIPDLLVSLPKLPPKELQKLKRKWNNRYKGQPHQVSFINWAIENFHKLADSNRDLEWLDGQRWYFKIVFAVFGVSPTETGFFENSNKSNDEGQERVTVRNALKPYYKLFEKEITNKLITEILQKEDHGLKFEYQPKDQALEKVEFEQDMLELDHGTMTINEFRTKKGRDEVEWGDDPLRKPFDESSMDFNNPVNNQNQPPNPNNQDNQDNQNKKFKKGFEVFMNDRES